MLVKKVYVCLSAVRSAINKMSCSKIALYLEPKFRKYWGCTCLLSTIFFLTYWFYGGLILVTLLLIIGLIALYDIQDNLLYHPEDAYNSRSFVQIPPVVGLPFENLFIRSIDGTQIHLYFIPQSGDKSLTSPTLVFLHGNAGNMGHRLQNVSGLYHSLHCNILMVEYRGYGLSKGKPSEIGLSMDARTAIDYLSLRKDIDHRQIIVFGRSLGGAVAIDLAARPEYSDKIWCLILENTFTSIPDMAKFLFHWRFVKYVPLIFYKNKFLSWFKISRVNTPTLFISGLLDTLVPPMMMTELHNRSGGINKKLLQIDEGTHNDTWTCPGYYSSIANFIKSLDEFKPDPPVVTSLIKDV